MKVFHRILFVGRRDQSEPWMQDLAARRFSVMATEDWQRGLDELTLSDFALVVIDLVSARDGIELIKRMRRLATLRRIPILVVGEWGTGLPSLAMSAGANAYEPTMDAAQVIGSVERLVHIKAAAAGARE
jgi:DNA-binding response OmpR family regulator